MIAKTKKGTMSSHPQSSVLMRLIQLDSRLQAAWARLPAEDRPRYEAWVGNQDGHRSRQRARRAANRIAMGRRFAGSPVRQLQAFVDLWRLPPSAAQQPLESNDTDPGVERLRDLGSGPAGWAG